MSGPKYGITVLAHVEALLEQSEAVVRRVNEASRRKLRPAERESLSRELAGVIASCETVRIWLAAGARR